MTVACRSLRLAKDTMIVFTGKSSDGSIGRLDQETMIVYAAVIREIFFRMH